MTKEEKLLFYKAERAAQLILDKWYIGRGHTVDRTTSCKLYDCILDNTTKVEEKIRSRLRTDIIIEMIQDIKSNASGWYFETGCDYLHYVFIDAGIIYRIKWAKFKKWYIDSYLTINKHGSYIISPRGWGITLNLIVPLGAIPNTIAEKYCIRKIEI